MSAKSAVAIPSPFRTREEKAREREEKREAVLRAAVRMFNAARLCAQNGHHAIAVRLLEMSVQLCPLQEHEARARIVRAAMHAAGTDDDAAGERGRLVSRCRR